MIVSVHMKVLNPQLFLRLHEMQPTIISKHLNNHTSYVIRDYAGQKKKIILDRKIKIILNRICPRCFFKEGGLFVLFTTSPDMRMVKSPLCLLVV